MRGGACVFGRLAAARGERGREPLVEGVHRDVQYLAKRIEEPLGLADLRAALAAQRQREPDDDTLRLLVTDELGQSREPGLRRARWTTQRGRASVPVGSETATPVRAAP